MSHGPLEPLHLTIRPRRPPPPGLARNIPPLPDAAPFGPPDSKADLRALALSVARIGTPDHPVMMPPTAVDAGEAARRDGSKVSAPMVAFFVMVALLTALPFFIARGSSKHVPTSVAHPASIPPIAFHGPVSGTLAHPSPSLEDSAPLPGSSIQLPQVMIAAEPPRVAEEPAPAPKAPRALPTTTATKAEVEPAPATKAEVEPAPTASTFDPHAARAALEAMAATASSRCGDAATGRLRVTVTFAPSGRATHAVVEESALQGTLGGECVARLFRGVQVPPFDGSLETVGLHVTLR